jgi:hypothetical protein
MGNNNFFENYPKKKKFSEIYKQSKFWVILVFAIFVLLFLTLFLRELKNTTIPEKLKESIKIVSQNSKWVNKKVSPYGVTIVPSITIKIKNIGKKPLKNVRYSGVFLYKEGGGQLGDGITRMYTTPLDPGETSEEILIKSFHGYKASSKKAFIINKKKWKEIKVKVFAEKSSVLVKIGEYPIKQEIDGIEDILISESEEEGTEKTKITNQLRNSIQVIWNKTKWIYKKATHKEIIIVPAISIKVKNLGENPIHNISFKGDFEIENTGESFGHGNTIALKKPLIHNNISNIIHVRAEYGYSIPSIQDLEQNKSNIKKIKVKLYAKSKNSENILLGIYPIKQIVKQDED